MAVKLHRHAFEHAKELIKDRHMAMDERGAGSEHQPTTQQENEYIRLHGLAEYGKWYLGIDDEKDERSKTRYEFRYGDFENVRRSGVLTAESRAGQYKRLDIENAAAHLHGMIDALR